MKNFREECAIVCITTSTMEYVMTVVHNSTGVFLTGKSFNRDTLEYNLLTRLRDKVYLANPKSELLWI